MYDISGIELNDGSSEEILPDSLKGFPCISSRVDTSHYRGGGAPWHWHKELELFYIQQGTLIYETPGKTYIFPAGSGGIVNQSILHHTYAQGKIPVLQMLHLFDSTLVSGYQGSLIDQKYVQPIVGNRAADIFRIEGNTPASQAALRVLISSFQEDAQDNQLLLQNKISEIWQYLAANEVLPPFDKQFQHTDERLKAMLYFIRAHYTEELTVPQIAESAYISARACYRLFHDQLHCTPISFLHTCRLQNACRLLGDFELPVLEVAQQCGFESNSYFGQVFRAAYHCSPREYRRKLAESR